MRQSEKISIYILLKTLNVISGPFPDHNGLLVGQMSGQPKVTRTGNGFRKTGKPPTHRNNSLAVLAGQTGVYTNRLKTKKTTSEDVNT